MEITLVDLSLGAAGELSPKSLPSKGTGLSHTNPAWAGMRLEGCMHNFLSLSYPSSYIYNYIYI